jgi:hypothetical protein
VINGKTAQSDQLPFQLIEWSFHSVQSKNGHVDACLHFLEKTAVKHHDRYFVFICEKISDSVFD